MLKEKIQKDLNDALKSGEQVKRLVLGTLLSVIKNKELEKRTKLSKSVNDMAELEKQSILTDDEVVQAIASEIKKRKESVELYRQGAREELAQKEEVEIKILQDYMPEQLSEDKIREEVVAAIKSTGAAGPQDMGKVIGAVVGKFKGQVDGGTVSKIAKELLAKS